MDERQRELDRRIRSAQRREFLRQLYDARLLLVLGACMLGLLTASALFSAAPTRLTAHVTGHTLSEATARANRQGQSVRLEVVQLTNGSVIELNMTADHPVAPGTALDIDVYTKDFGPLHQTSYRFVGYSHSGPTA